MVESLGRCAGPCLGPMVTTLVSAIEGAGSPPLSRWMKDVELVPCAWEASFPQQVVLFWVWLCLVLALP